MQQPRSSVCFFVRMQQPRPGFAVLLSLSLSLSHTTVDASSIAEVVPESHAWWSVFVGGVWPTNLKFGGKGERRQHGRRGWRGHGHDLRRPHDAREPGKQSEHPRVHPSSTHARFFAVCLGC